MSRRLLGIALILAVAFAMVNFWPAPQHVAAFQLFPCHDDTHIDRNWTHGNPNDGTFAGGPPNHSNSYYYLNISTGPCVRSVDGQIHVVGRVTAFGVGNPKRTDLTNERPAWGFEYVHKDTTKIVHPCAGGDGSGGNNCSEHPGPVIATPGYQTVEWRYDGNASALRFRVANLYDEAIWEYATLDVVACATCEPSGSSSPTPRATPPPTPVPTATSTPTPQSGPTFTVAIQLLGFTCAITVVNGVVSGSCH